MSRSWKINLLPESKQEEVPEGSSSLLYYKLNENRQAVPADAPANIGEPVARTVVNSYTVSTVFLSINHSFSRSGRPVLFETMVFPENSLNDLYCRRYCTWEEAEIGHSFVVSELESGTLPQNIR